MLGYVFVALGLMGVFFSVMGNTGRVNAAHVSDQITGSKIVSQAQTVQAELIACTVGYPLGNNGTAYRLTLPAAATAANISALTCPGKPVGNNLLFGSADSSALPAQMTGMGVWQFINDATSARLTLTATTGNYSSALAYAATKLGSAAVVVGNTLTVTFRT